MAIPLGAFLLGLVFWNLRGADPMWAIVSFVLVFDPNMRTARLIGLARLIHTAVGTGLALGLIFLLGVHRWLMPLGLGVAVLICGLILKFRGTWRVLLITVALVIGASLYNEATGVSVALLRGAEVFAGSLLGIGFSWVISWLSPDQG